MEQKVAIEEIKYLSQMDEDIKKEVVNISQELLTIFVEKMKDNKASDALNITINIIALFTSSIVQSMSTEVESQNKTADIIHHFIQVYLLAAKNKKEESQ